MDTQGFGEILRTTRESKGLDFIETARTLRIRPDILQAIEEENFEAMPPRGYSRNMVNGYARYLGLNPAELSGMYLDQYYDYQQSLGADYIEEDEFAPVSASEASTSSVRDQVDAASEFETAGRRQSPRAGASHTVGAGDGMQSKLPYVLAAALVLLIVIALSALLFGGPGAQEESTTNMPVTGVDQSQSEATTDQDGNQNGDQGASSESGSAESGSESSASGSQSAAAVDDTPAPTNFEVEYTVEDGKTPWIQLYVDGEAKTSETIYGPFSEKYTAESEVQFVCDNPEGIKFMIDGEEVKLEADSTGAVNKTITMDDILAQFKTNHPNSALAQGSNSSNASAAEGSSSASESSSSSDSSSSSSSAQDQEFVAYTANGDGIYYDEATGNYIDSGTGYYGYFDDYGSFYYF